MSSGPTPKTKLKRSTKDVILVVAWTLALMYLFHQTAKADDYSFKYGMGLLDGSPTGQIKLFAFRNEAHELYAIHSAREVGFWVDNVGNGRSRGTAFGKYQFGVKPGPEVGVYGKAFWGVQLQSGTDSELGGILQFSQDAGLGIRDETSFVEAGYGHVSSAGIFLPNRGRDFVTLSCGIRF